MALSSAFRVLRRKGLIARQQFMCCQGCALNKLAQEYNAAEPKPAGYVFFHRQDAKTFARDGCVHLAFGVFGHEQGARTARDVGKLVVEACEAAGCPVDWSGNPGTKILVWRDANTRRAHAARRLGATIPA
jgi:hypothetical protein